ncbi:MAG: NAD-dependent protein deacylase [Planctomycetota bacterium]|nr:MAG: NAD-dependent protein deacylase [Planctomycetota bacterium]
MDVRNGFRAGDPRPGKQCCGDGPATDPPADSTDWLQVVDRIAEWIRGARFGVALTGAGISTDSGIPDFRSPGGVWSRSRPVYFDEFLSSERARREYWRQKAEAHDDIVRAQPNIVHRSLADWERRGLLHGVITQNIDGLHQLAGSRRVLELHGTARLVACLNCDWSDEADRWVAEFRERGQVPPCPRCGGIIKHATVSFGQALRAEVLEQAADWARKADLFLALGSSLVVQPAASLPVIAAENGARVVIINREPTPVDAEATVTVRAELAPVFRRLAERLTECAGG